MSESNYCSGWVASIKRNMIHDGPGIRTTVFLKGCPLRCQWCSSPQTWKLDSEVIFLNKKCIGCGLCAGTCENDAIKSEGHRIDYKKCINCGGCVEVCPAHALRYSAKRMVSEEVVDTVKRDMNYYVESGGGVTLSGGEILMQASFAKEILQLCQKAHIHTAIESSAYGDWEDLQEILKYTDIAYFDLKHVNEQEHKKYTGVSNKKIKNNIEKAVQSGLCRVVLNIPLVPGVNDDEKNLEELALFMKALSISDLRVLPFHKLGEHEYIELGMKYSMAEHEAFEKNELIKKKDYLIKRGINIVKS